MSAESHRWAVLGYGRGKHVPVCPGCGWRGPMQTTARAAERASKAHTKEAACDGERP